MAKYNLLSYQKKAIEKLKKIKVGALFMEQGTGKTITALELCSIRLKQNKINRIVWLCPCACKNEIKLEIMKMADDNLIKHIVICGIETLSRSFVANTYLLQLHKTDDVFLIVDESTLIKNIRANRTNNILRLGKLAKYKLILSGTPMTKNASDLYAQFLFLDWRILGYRSFWSFASNHLEFCERTNRIVRSLNLDYLSRKIEPYTFQIKKEECLDLPEKNYVSYNFFLTDEQFAHYRYVADRLLFELDEMESTTIYRLFTGLQAVVSGKKLNFYQDENNQERFKTVPFFNCIEENPRLQCLKKIIEKEDNKKIIIFCRYTSDVSEIESFLGNEAIRFDGTISQKRRTMNLEKFKSESQKRFLVMNLNCGSYSLNLQFCDTIIYYSHSWDLALRLQSEDRVHRYGQKNKVRIYDIYAEMTIDKKTVQCLSRKENMLEQFKEFLAKNQREYITDMIFPCVCKDLEDI